MKIYAVQTKQKASYGQNLIAGAPVVHEFASYAARKKWVMRGRTGSGECYRFDITPQKAKELTAKGHALSSAVRHIYIKKGPTK